MTIDAMGCQVAIADKIVEHKADYLLALKGNQPILEAEVAQYFSSAPAEELVVRNAEIEKGRGRIEMRTYRASSEVDWRRSLALPHRDALKSRIGSPAERRRPPGEALREHRAGEARP